MWPAVTSNISPLLGYRLTRSAIMLLLMSLVGGVSSWPSLAKKYVTESVSSFHRFPFFPYGWIVSRTAVARD